MQLKLYSKNSIRVTTGVSEPNFLDIKSLEWEGGLMVENWSDSKQYMEIREKNGQTAVFFFMRKSAKKDVDLGHWEDAEVIFSKNKVKH